MASIFQPGGGTSSGDMIYDPSLAFKGGSRHGFVHKVSGYNGASASDDWTQLPGRVGFTLTPSTSKQEITWEDDTTQNLSTTVTWESSIKTAQKDKGTLLSLYYLGNGLVLQHLMEITPTAVVTINSTAKRQYATFMHVITDPPAFDSKATEVEIKGTVGSSTATISIDLSNAYVRGTAAGTVFPNFGATTGTVTHASGRAYDLTEL